MTIEETGIILTYLETLFPQSYRGQSDQQKRLTVVIWQQEFATHSFAEVQAAVRSAIREKKANGFAPGFDEILAQLRSTGLRALPGIDEYESQVVAFLEERRKQCEHDGVNSSRG